MDFWARVKGEIKAQNTTQEWVSAQVPVSLRTFQGWVSRGILPDVAQATRIAKALGTTVEYLVTGQAPKGQSYRHLGPNATTILKSIQTIPDDELKDMALLAKAKADAAAADPMAEVFGSGRQSAARSG